MWICWGLAVLCSCKSFSTKVIWWLAIVCSTLTSCCCCCLPICSWFFGWSWRLWSSKCHTHCWYRHDVRSACISWCCSSSCWWITSNCWLIFSITSSKTCWFRVLISLLISILYSLSSYWIPGPVFQVESISHFSSAPWLSAFVWPITLSPWNFALKFTLEYQNVCLGP